MDGGIQEAIEIQQGGDLTEQGGGTLTLQQDFQTADLQANVIQDALVSDVQLSSTINPQVLCKFNVILLSIIIIHVYNTCV